MSDPRENHGTSAERGSGPLDVRPSGEYVTITVYDKCGHARLAQAVAGLPLCERREVAQGGFETLFMPLRYKTLPVGVVGHSRGEGFEGPGEERRIGFYRL